MKAIYFGLIFGFFVSSAFASETSVFSIDAFKRAVLEPKALRSELNPIREADLGFIVQKNWVEKDNQGHFVQKSEKICEQKVKANVFDVRGIDWNYPSMRALATCQTILNAKDGSAEYQMNIDLGGFIYINNTNGGRAVKNFAPWAYPHGSGAPNWVMNSIVTTPTLELQEIVFNLGNQTESFFQNETIVIMGSFSDKNQ
ncbi:MAG: hypothetical protein JWQ35_1832 [Bacteriovoracaceae bacterium]|nr:hypothetical protein [Bacteriovoracaceae bacterium]